MLRNIVIPSTIKRIGDRAFLSCTQLTDVEIENGLSASADETTIFSGCKLISAITVPEYITDRQINRVFPNSYTNIKKVVLNKDTKIYNKYAFDLCTSILSVKIPKSICDVNGIKMSILFEDSYTKITDVILDDDVT